MVKKKKYEVTLYYTSSYTTVVNAENEEDAYLMVIEKENTSEWQEQVLHNLSGGCDSRDIIEL